MKRAKKTSDKSKLVKKHLEFVDCNSYNEALGSKQRGKGIYILYKGDDVYYIGLSKRSLRGRIGKHATKDRHKGEWDKFSFYQIGKTNSIKSEKQSTSKMWNLFYCVFFDQWEIELLEDLRKDIIW